MELISDAQLAELDRLKAAGKLGPMVSVHIVSKGYEHCANLCTRLEGHKSDYPMAMMQSEWADDIAATLNSYPAIRARLEAAEREREEAIQALRRKHCAPLKGQTLAEAITAALDNMGTHCDTIAAEAARLRDVVVRYRNAQRRMLDRWSEVDDEEKQHLWRGLHACEQFADAALTTPATDAYMQGRIAEAVEPVTAEAAMLREKLDKSTHKLMAICEKCDGLADVEDDENGVANRPNFALRVLSIADVEYRRWKCGGKGEVPSGVCHCGDNMQGHSVYDNHTATDHPMPCSACERRRKVIDYPNTDAWLARYTAKVRTESLKEAAEHCRKSELLMPIPSPGCTLREHGGNVAMALSRELRAMAETAEREQAGEEGGDATS